NSEPPGCNSDGKRVAPFTQACQTINKQNEFGATVGGPVVIPKIYNGKDGTFFFGWYQGFGLRKHPSTGLDTLPTPAMRGGDLSNILGPQVALSACNPTPVKEPPPPPLPCSDASGRPVFQGELYDPSTARSVAPGAVDALTGLPTATVNPDGSPATSPWLLRDAFGFDNLTGLPIAGAANIIPTGRIDPVAAKIFSY